MRDAAVEVYAPFDADAQHSSSHFPTTIIT